MTDIVLATQNAKYAHAALGLRYLRANLGALRDRSVIVEFTINDRPIDVVEKLLALSPKVIGLGVYIWNVTLATEVVRLLKQVAPSVRIVLGGPEVSHETEQQPIVGLADHVITGEGDLGFRELCQRILAGQAPLTRVLPGGLPGLDELALPYDEYSDHDLAHRVVYVEASRGCPFSCEFCLSSLDEKVRTFAIDRVLASLDALVARGARQFKFVDRTFNLSPKTSAALLQFFLDRRDRGLFAHFEVVPDRFPAALRDLVKQFAPGALQLEVGIQTFDPETSGRISRRLDIPAVETNLAFLASTDAHVHADLIIGLPGEDLTSFARGFDRLVACRPDEVQVGVLKRLRGTPIDRHDREYDVVWSAAPPYEIVENRMIRFGDMQRLKRFARAWDFVANRGNFPSTLPVLLADAPFGNFMALTEWLAPRMDFGAPGLTKLVELLLEFLTSERGLTFADAGALVARDFAGPGRKVPRALEPYVTATATSRAATGAAPARQARHVRGNADSKSP